MGVLWWSLTSHLCKAQIVLLTICVAAVLQSMLPLVIMTPGRTGLFLTLLLIPLV